MQDDGGGPHVLFGHVGCLEDKKENIETPNCAGSAHVDVVGRFGKCDGECWAKELPKVKLTINPEGNAECCENNKNCQLFTTQLLNFHAYILMLIGCCQGSEFCIEKLKFTTANVGPQNVWHIVNLCKFVPSVETLGPEPWLRRVMSWNSGGRITVVHSMCGTHHVENFVAGNDWDTGWLPQCRS